MWVIFGVAVGLAGAVLAMGLRVLDGRVGLPRLVVELGEVDADGEVRLGLTLGVVPVVDDVLADWDDLPVAVGLADGDELEELGVVGDADGEPVGVSDGASDTGDGVTDRSGCGV